MSASKPSATAQPFAIQDFIDRQTHTSAPQRWVWALCFVVVLLDGIDTAAIGYIAPALLQDWGLERAALAPVLSAALFGVAAGAWTAGPLADWIGRRAVLLASVAVFGACCLASAFAGDIHSLALWRFATGVGLGAAMPTAVTLVSEYSPSARRAMVTNAVFCAFPLGAALGGWLAAALIPRWGWPSVLLAGGIAPLMLLVFLWWKLPESVRHLASHVARAGHIERLRALLQRMTSQSDEHKIIAQADDFIVDFHPNNNTKTSSAQTAQTASSWRILMQPRYRFGTVALWVAYFMGLVIFYALINWLPVLLLDAGVEQKNTALMASLFPLGGVGAVALGWVMDRFNATRALAAGYALTALAIWALAASIGAGAALMMAALLLMGIVMNTTQAAMPALAAAWYPTAARATGVAWMLGAGRFGGIAGALLVAQLTAWSLTLEQILALIGCTGLIAAAAMWMKDAADKRWG